MEEISALSPKDKIRNYHSERDVLSGLIKFPEAIHEVEGWLSEKDFHSPITSKLFSLISNLLVTEGVKKIDSALLLSKIRDRHYSFFDVNITDFIHTLITNSSDIQYSTVVTLAKSIKLFSVRRDVFEGGTKLQQAMVSNKNLNNLPDIVAVSDQVYFEMMRDFQGTSDMKRIGEGLEERMHKIADNPVKHIGFSSGFPLYDELIGHIRPDSFNFVAARAKVGKSILGLNVARNVSQFQNMPVFYGDSEMDDTMMQDRMVSHISGVDIYYVETGNWKRNPEICGKVLEAMKIVKSLNIQYFSLRATNTQQFISACRRFLFRHVGRNPEGGWNPCLFVWDYIKLNYYEEKGLGDSWWLNIAKSVVHFKDFLGSTKTAGFVLGQSNREGIARMDKNGKMVSQDSESTVAGSDEILKTASNVSQLRYKTADEIKRDGENSGDCLLMPFVCRTGRGGAWVQLSEGIFEREYVCLKREAAKNTFSEITTNKLLREKDSISSSFKSK